MLLISMAVLSCNNSNNYDHSRVSILLYSNGKIREVDSVKAGKRNGPSIKYFEDGKIESYSIYNNDTLTGNYYRKYENGNICQQGNYKNGLQNGLSVWLDENGDTIKKIIWSKGMIVFDEEYRNGKHIAAVDFVKKIRIIYKDTSVFISPLK